jgi:hypothetical protein
MSDVKLFRNDSAVLMVVLLVAAIFPQTVRAVLWKTEEQLSAQYGEPKISRDLNDRTFTYQFQDLKLDVHFQDGVSQSVRYTCEERTKPFSPEEIEVLLEANSDGKTWHRKDGETWELGSPPVARAAVYRMESTIFENGIETLETYHSFEVETLVFGQEQMAKAMEPSEPHSRTGAEKHFQGVLEFKDEENDNRVAIIRDGKTVLEIPWAWRNYPGKAELEPGQTYEVTLREDEEMVDMDAAVAFVSDRVHKSHPDRVQDSEFFLLVRIKQAGEVVFDESVCEVHQAPMQRTMAKVGYGMYGAPSEADAVCDRKYPHHADWIRGGCLVGDVESAFHYVCPECVAAAARYKREHPEETAP